MEEIIRGKAYVLGENIDTDQIIPAQHLVYSLSNPDERKLYGKYALSGVPEAKAGLPQGNAKFVEDGCDSSVYKIIVAGKNFGCGSSREHAPVCLNIAGVQAVVAPSYARIFYRNAVDGGFFVPFESAEDLSQTIRTGDDIEIRVKDEKLKNFTTGQTHRLRSLGDVADILEAGDVFAYARKAGLIKAPAVSTGTSPESFQMPED
jgi:3-isopropylmalate/(R)-2-methylmalate dehydratase small subunit